MHTYVHIMQCEHKALPPPSLLYSKNIGENDKSHHNYNTNSKNCNSTQNANPTPRHIIYSIQNLSLSKLC